MAFDFPNAPTTGQLYQGYIYDGEKWISTTTPSPPNQSGVISIQVFTTSGQYTPSANMTTCVIECVGGGGGGGGVTAATSFYTSGGGGGGGAYARKIATAAQIGVAQTVTVGAGGTRTLNAAGGAGNTSSVGTLCVAVGGAGGALGTTATRGAGSAGGSAGSSTGDFTLTGGTGTDGFYVSAASAAVAPAGNGGSTYYGTGAAGRATNNASVVNGFDGANYGSGGGGACSNNQAGSNASGGLGSPGLVVITEYGMTALSSASSQQGSVRYDLPQGLSANQKTQARTNIATHLRGVLFDLTLSTPGSSTSFTVNSGEAADSTGSDLMVLSAPLTKTSAAWVVGAGGALDTGTVAINTWYHVFLIKRPDTGVVDVLISLSPTAPTLPANYTLFRRIGSLRYTASSFWYNFIQNGDEFQFIIGNCDLNNQTVSTARSVISLLTPLGISTVAMISVQVLDATSANAFLTVTPVSYTDGAPNMAAAFYGAVRSGPVNIAQVIVMPIRTNTSSQIALRSSTTTSTVSIVTYGWIDRRGRDS